MRIESEPRKQSDASKNDVRTKDEISKKGKKKEKKGSSVDSTNFSGSKSSSTVYDRNAIDENYQVLDESVQTKCVKKKKKRERRESNSDLTNLDNKIFNDSNVDKSAQINGDCTVEEKYNESKKKKKKVHVSDPTNLGDSKDVNETNAIDECIEISDEHGKKKRKKRKRELSNDDTEVYKKQQKTNKCRELPLDQDDSETHDKTHDESQENIPAGVRNDESGHLSEDSNADNEKEKNVTESDTKQMTGKFLRKRFAQSDGIDTLKKFVMICTENKERDLAAEYLHAGGSILEVLKLLDNVEKNKISNTCAVFSAINILIMKILAQYPQYQSSADEACRHLMNSYMSSIHMMLQISTKQRKIVLRMLAAMVSLGGDLPRELLTHFNLQPQVLEMLVEHAKPRDPQNVRTCYIHFVLAFLVEKNTLVIRALLDKPSLLSSIFPGLIYDSQVVVSLVLTTMKSCIVENPAISKTMKLHLFSTPVVKSLVNLYNWKGPKNWRVPKKNARERNIEDTETKENVVDDLHEFLIVLLTSHRHGVVFHDRSLGTSKTQYNQLLLSVLQSLESPWEHEKPSDLVIRILVSCPDLVQSQIGLIRYFMEPRVSPRWIALMKFLRKIIESVNFENCLQLCLVELNKTQLTDAIISIIIPTVIMTNAIIPSLNHKNMIVHHEAVLLLTVIFNQLKNFLTVVKAHGYNATDLHSVRSIIMEHVVKDVPNVNLILKIWSHAIEPVNQEDVTSEKEGVVKESKQEHLGAILDLLEVYKDVCPELMDATTSDFKPTVILNALDELSNNESEFVNIMKVKAIQFLYALDSTEFSPQKEMFSKALSFLIPLLSGQDPKIFAKAADTTKTILNASGLFEGCNDQVDIWINGFSILETSNDKAELINWFISTIKSTTNHIDKYINIITKAEEIAGEQIICATRSKDILKELLVTEDTNQSSLAIVNQVRMQSSTSISPLLCCAIKKAKNDSDPMLLSYLTYILLRTLHYQVAPGALIHLLKDIELLPLQKYMTSWLQENQPTYVKKIFSSETTMGKLNKLLLTDSKITLSEIFTGDTTVSFEYAGENVTVHHSLTAYEILCTLRMSVFYLTQFSQRYILTEVQSENYKIIIVSLLNAARHIMDEYNVEIMEECAKIIFTNPIILQYFSPLHHDESMNIEKLITGIVLEISKVLTYLGNTQKLRAVLSPFKNKLLTQLVRAMDDKKSNANKNTETVVSFLELVQLNEQDVVDLLKRLVAMKFTKHLSENKLHMSVYGNITCKLLQMACRKERNLNRAVYFALDIIFVKRLMSLFLFLRSSDAQDLKILDESLHRYFDSFPHNIAGVTMSTFTLLLTRGIQDSTIKLISFWVSRSAKLMQTFTKHAIQSESVNQSMLLSIISNNVKHVWNRELLEKLLEFYKGDIIAYLSDPKSQKIQDKENTEGIIYLIENAFDMESCEKTCAVISQIGDKLDMVSVNYIKILESLYNRYIMLKKEDHDILTDLIQVLVYITMLTLKKESKNTEKLLILCKGLMNAVDRFKKTNNSVFASLSSNHAWPQFTRFSLKLGLKISKDDAVVVPILQTLNKLCDIAYSDDGDTEYVKTLFEMATSHSEFVNIMLSNSSVKRHLIELLWILIRKNKLVMISQHVPLYLAAYSATLNETDQLILLILQYYESSSIRIDDYRPYLWGNAAATFYSVKGETDTALWRQPSTTQVFNLFEKEIVINTVKRYPINRGLKDSDLHGESNVYDPAFYLPLICHLLSENNVVACHRVTHSGALALALSACGSTQKDVRMAAYTVISRYYFHLEASSTKERFLWIRLVDALRNGVVNLETPLEDARLSCLVSTFLANTTLVGLQPLHPLYSSLHNFLMAKPALDVNTIPELLQLLNNSEVNYRVHRHWILKTIRDGIRTEFDVKVAERCFLFKMLLDYYSSILCGGRTKKLILEVLVSTTKIPKSAMTLIRGYSLLPWLCGTVRQADTWDTETIDLVINVTNNILNVLTHTKEHRHYKHMVSEILSSLQPHILKCPVIATFTRYTQVLKNILDTKFSENIVDKQNIVDLVVSSKSFLGDVDEIEDMLHHGCVHMTKNDVGGDNELDVARSSLRALVRSWWCTSKR